MLFFLMKIFGIAILHLLVAIAYQVITSDKEEEPEEKHEDDLDDF